MKKVIMFVVMCLFLGCGSGTSNVKAPVTCSPCEPGYMCNTSTGLCEIPN